MRLLNKSLTESVYSALNESGSFFEDMIWNRISEYADPEEYFLDKLTDKDVTEIAKDLKDIWDNGNFEQEDLDSVMEKYAFIKYGKVNESLKESEKYTIEYWADERARDEGYGETEYITAKDLEEAIAKTRDMFYDNSWASCELFDETDENNQYPLFGMYPSEDRKRDIEEVRFDDFDVSLKEKEKMNEIKSLIWSCLKDNNPITVSDVINSCNGKFVYDSIVKAAKSLDSGGYVSFNENDELITKTMNESVNKNINESVKNKKRFDRVKVNESVTVTAGSTYVTVDETGVMVDDNGTTVTVNGGATVNIENNELVPEVPMGDMGAEAPLEPIEGEVPVESEEPTEEAPAEDGEEVIEPSEELLEPEKEDELEEAVDEGASKKVTSEDLNSAGVNYVITLNDGSKQYVSCFWSSNEVEPEDIGEGENIEDYGAINYDIYDATGEQVDGGLMITKEDSFDEEKLCKDLCAMSGYPEDIKVERKANGDYMEVFGMDESLKENAGDPNSTVEIYKNPEFDYSIKDITELDNVDVGDVRSIDMFSILNGLEERLQERYGTENWGLLNTFQTRQGKHKKTNESYASAILDISIPKNKRLQELNTVLTVEVYGDKALKECVVKDARYNKRIERFCGKTKDPVKFLEGVMVDLVNNRAKLKLTNYQPMTEDTKTLKEEVADEAYELAEYIENRCGGDMQEGVNGESILRRDDFDRLFIEGMKKIAGLSDKEVDAYFNGELGRDVCGEDDAWDLEVTVRSIMGYDGYETIYESDEERDADEGDLVKLVQGPVNEDVEFMVGKPYEDKGMNFADGKAIDKDVKRQERHIKQHKSLGKSTKKFKVEKEPDQKNTQGKKVEDLTDTVEPSKEGGKKKKSPSKKKKSVKESLEGNNAFWEKGVKSGAKFPSDAGEIEILDLDKNSNYILGKRRSKWSKDGKDDYVSYVAAWNPELVGDKITWGQGHYFDSQDSDNEKNARDYFEKKKLGEGVNEDADRIVLKPVENFDFTDPYGEYYSDDNGNLYKSVDNGNELYICTKAGEPLKDVEPSNYILGDKALNELTEAKGLLDDEDTPTESDVEGDSEDLVDIDDSELEEGATEVAIFHRRPASIDAMKQAEANGITVNKSNYKIIGTKELSKEEFEDFAKHLSSGSYSWLKDMYKADNSNSGTFNCIEVKNMDDSSMTLLVDPNGYDYARYVAMKPENVEENSEDIEEEPIEEPEVAE